MAILLFLNLIHDARSARISLHHIILFSSWLFDRLMKARSTVYFVSFWSFFRFDLIRLTQITGSSQIREKASSCKQWAAKQWGVMAVRAF